LADRTTDAADWLQPTFEQSPARRYLQTLRERAWLVALTVAVTTLAAVAYVATAEDVYQAEADVLISPVPREDTLLSGLALLRDSADPGRDVETAARLITAPDVEQQVEDELDVQNPNVTAEPVADSNVVTITAEASNPGLARDIANGFARTAIDERTNEFHAQLDQAIRALRTRVDASDTQGGPLGDELVRLQSLRGTPDPTMRLETPAVAPGSASWPKPALSIAAGIIAGLILGVGGVFGVQLLDPRLRREEDLRSLYNLPLLARIPAERGKRGRDRHRPIPPQELSAAGIEAFRSLRFALAAAQGDRHGASSVLVTGASPSEGKTTVAVNLAVSLALAGRKVILIDADLRRPGVSRALGEPPGLHGIVSVLLERVTLRHALVTPERFGGNLALLLAEESEEWLPDRLSLPAARKLIGEAKELAEYVIIDTPPLIEVTDALPLAQRADDVLLVARLGRSHVDRLARLGETLAHQGIRPVGLVVVGVGRPRREYYYRPQREPWSREVQEPRELEQAGRESSPR
jgi:Mrp family chromosome partitioning ATPase/capsular polysaccharide biosynthesis protein